MLVSYNMQSWTAINTSSGAFFLHLAHALMLSPAPLPQPLLIHCVHCLVAAAAKVADNKPQLASDKLQRCYESPQLGLPATQFPCYAAAELKIQIAQGFGLQPYNKHSVIEICAEAKPVSALLLGVQRMQFMEKSFLLCTPDRLHKRCDARRAALFASLFQKVWHLASVRK